MNYLVACNGGIVGDSTDYLGRDILKKNSARDHTPLGTKKVCLPPFIVNTKRLHSKFFLSTCTFKLRQHQ